MKNFEADIEKTSEILGKEKINALIHLFEELNGQPPCVEKKRYRANHVNEIKALDYLEHDVQLIKTDYIDSKDFYFIRPYALPLIQTPKSQNLINLMGKIYDRFAVFYKENLDTPVTKKKILYSLNLSNKEVLEALSYFKDTHNILTSWSTGFPYDDGSQICLSEGVLLKENILEVLTDYYRWHLIDKDNSAGRPSIRDKIIDAYEHLKKDGLINYSTLTSNIKHIQDKVRELYPDEKNNFSNTGMQKEAIRRAVGEQFKADKSSKLTSKL